MIIWVASYPKSGNTWLRALLSSYFYSHDGNYNENLLKEIDQFPVRKYFEKFDYDKNIVADTTKFWIKAQDIINSDNKIKFFKTHNVFGKVNNFDFTNTKNSIGAVYIVRDPRNVITSIKNHYELDDETAFKWMTDENNYIYDIERVKQVGYGDFQFISSWDLNYKSWKIQKKIPIKFIRYEDLTNQTYAVFLELVEFIYKVTNNSEIIDKTKLKNALNSTTFEKLKRREKEHGFSEAVSFTSNEKAKFFNLGPKNNWKEMLNKNLEKQISELYKSDLEELSYS